jgi:hypothetical protein
VAALVAMRKYFHKTTVNYINADTAPPPKERERKKKKETTYCELFLSIIICI